MNAHLLEASESHEALPTEYNGPVSMPSSHRDLEAKSLDSEREAYAQRTARQDEAIADLKAQLQAKADKLEKARREKDRLEASINEEVSLRRKIESDSSLALSQAQEEIGFLKACLTELNEKAEAEKDSATQQQADKMDAVRLENELATLQIRYNTLKKQYDAKSAREREHERQLDVQRSELERLKKELQEADTKQDAKAEEREAKFLECSKENKALRQKIASLSRDFQLADAEHRRIASAHRLMAPQEFARKMQSDEMRCSLSQEAQRLARRNDDLETDLRCKDKVLQRLRQERGLGDFIEEAWRQELAADGLGEDPGWDN